MPCVKTCANRAGYAPAVYILLSLLVAVATDDASFPVSPATRLDRGDEVAFLNSLVVE